MVGYRYDDNLPNKKAHRQWLRVFIFTGLIVLILAIAYVIYDAVSDDFSVSQTTASVGTLGEQTDRKVFDEKYFRLTTDDSWEKVRPRDDKYSEFRYQSTDKELVKREIRIFVNNIPPKFSVPYILPIEVVDNRVAPLAVSPKCDQLQENKKNRSDVTVSWAGVEFICDPDSGLSLVGTSHNEMGYLVEVPGLQGLTKNKFFFAYLDLEPSPSFNLFSNLLQNFEAK